MLHSLYAHIISCAKNKALMELCCYHSVIQVISAKNVMKRLKSLNEQLFRTRKLTLLTA